MKNQNHEIDPDSTDFYLARKSLFVLPFTKNVNSKYFAKNGVKSGDSQAKEYL